MWIRSQDKRSLSNINDVLITTTTDGNHVIYGFSGKGRCVLGVYSTFDKAFKVLDMIERLIIHPASKRITHSNHVNEGQREYITEEITVIPMPQDEDVEL